MRQEQPRTAVTRRALEQARAAARVGPNHGVHLVELELGASVAGVLVKLELGAGVDLELGAGVDLSEFTGVTQPLNGLRVLELELRAGIELTRLQVEPSRVRVDFLCSTIIALELRPSIRREARAEHHRQHCDAYFTLRRHH